MLAINTFQAIEQAYSISLDDGHVKIGFAFEDNVEVYQSCSLVFKGTMYVFGGAKENRQIAQVTTKDCGLKRLGSLSFDFVQGACTVIEGDEIMLCFDIKANDQGRVCRIDKNPTGSLDKISQESNHYHYKAKIAANKGTISNLLKTKRSKSPFLFESPNCKLDIGSPFQKKIS